jgi:hypothetical protein
MVDFLIKRQEEICLGKNSFLLRQSLMLIICTVWLLFCSFFDLSSSNTRCFPGRKKINAKRYKTHNKIVNVVAVAVVSGVADFYQNAENK